MSLASKVKEFNIRAAGFTLVELVAVIVVLGILSVSMTGILSLGMNAHIATNNRTQMVNDGRFLIERITRELRVALPGSVRVAVSGGNQCIEFVPIVAAATYKKDDLPVAPASASSFKAVDFSFFSGSDYFVAVATTDAIAVYGVGTDFRHAISSVSDVDVDNFRTINLNAASSFPAESPTRRMYIVKAPVSYCSIGSRIYRYEGYGYSNSQSVPPSNAVLMGEGLDDAVDPFNYVSGTLIRNAIVELRIVFETDNERVEFSHDIQLRNVI